MVIGGSDSAAETLGNGMDELWSYELMRRRWNVISERVVIFVIPSEVEGSQAAFGLM